MEKFVIMLEVSSRTDLGEES